MYNINVPHTHRPIKVGDILFDVNQMEEHTVISVGENGYLLIQCSSMKNAGLSGDKNIIHKSKVDGINICNISAP